MAFRFVFTADVHLDSPLATLALRDPELAELIGGATRKGLCRRYEMNFGFLHAADLHLGSPFLGLAQKDSEVAARFARASRTAFEDLVTQALEEDVSFVVIAGDVFDGEWKDASIALFLNRQLARLSNRGIPTFLFRGNHDAESLVTKSLTWSENVFEFSTRRAETHRIEICAWRCMDAVSAP